eukprot:15056817-Alexandrium_andersonii.AAC.1
MSYERPNRRQVRRDVALCDGPAVETLVVDITSGYSHAEPTVAPCRFLRATGRGGGGIDMIADL